MPRKKTNLDLEQIEKLAALHCTMQEIALPLMVRPRVPVP